MIGIEKFTLTDVEALEVLSKLGYKTKKITDFLVVLGLSNFMKSSPGNWMNSFYNRTKLCYRDESDYEKITALLNKMVDFVTNEYNNGYSYYWTLKHIDTFFVSNYYKDGHVYGNKSAYDLYGENCLGFWTISNIIRYNIKRNIVRFNELNH